MRISRKLTAVAVTAAAVATGAVMNAAPAYAALYGGQCGTGYNVVNLIDLPDLRGTVYLTYSNATGKNCVVTVRERPGTATLMEAFLRKSGGASYVKDSGNFTTYAGPVYVPAAGSCVDWGGTIGTATMTKTGTNCG